MDFLRCGSNDDDGSDEYYRDTINVDYNGVNNAVFFDFSTRFGYLYFKLTGKGSPWMLNNGTT